LRHHLPVLLIALIAVALSGAAPGAIANDEPTRGVNLRLLPYLDRVATTPLEEIERLNGARLDLAQKAGFNSLRLGVPMEPWIEKLSTAGQEKTLELLRRVVSSVLERNLRLDVALFVPARKIVCEEQYQEGYRAGLNAILAQLPDRPEAGIEIVNEPPSCSGPAVPTAQWGKMQQDLYRAVRAAKRQILFVVAGGGWGQIDGMLQLDPDPFRSDPNTLYTFHYYEPFIYTSQEVAWLRPDHVNKYVKDLAWPVEVANASAVRDKALAAVANDKSLTEDTQREDRKSLSRLFDEYAIQGTTRYLSSRFRAVADWAAAHNLSTSRILLGEFGVHRHMPSPNVVEEPWPTAASWLEAVRREAENRHMGWVVWDLDSGFGVICGTGPGAGELCPSYRAVFAK
jgi:endoglucanase